MPFINLKTTKEISKENEAILRADFGEKIALIPGKSENWLMLNFEDNCRMAFRGEATPDIAMIEVELFGGASESAYERLTAALTASVERTLGIRPDRIYVKYEEISTWGYNGGNF